LSQRGLMIEEIVNGRVHVHNQDRLTGVLRIGERPE
jgi:hypothetical protein